VSFCKTNICYSLAANFVVIFTVLLGNFFTNDYVCEIGFNNPTIRFVLITICRSVEL
jgi:hypothetical protein